MRKVQRKREGDELEEQQVRERKGERKREGRGSHLNKKRTTAIITQRRTTGIACVSPLDPLSSSPLPGS